MKIKGYTLSVLIPSKWGFFWSGSPGVVARGTWCAQIWRCAGFGDLPTKTAVAWKRKIGAGTLPGMSGATDIQEKLLYPGARGELKAPALGSAAHQFLPLQTELLNSSWFCLPLNLCVLPQGDIHVCLSLFALNKPPWGRTSGVHHYSWGTLECCCDRVTNLWAINPFCSWIQSAFSWFAFKTLLPWDEWQHVAAFLGTRGLLWAGNG